MSLEVQTFGCRLNIWESEVMRGLAAGAGLDEAVIVNTCAVTSEAERQARQAIGRINRTRPGVPIIVTGCAAELRPGQFASLPGVSRVIGNGRKLDPVAWGHTAASETLPVLDGFANNTRGFVQVQQGCDHRCTFCVIPYARGPSRSVPLGTVVECAQRLVASGHKEIVPTGVDLTSWGGDLPGKPPLGQLLRRLMALVPDLPRLRLSSLDPAEIDPDLWAEIMDNPRLMPHFHFSAQAGDNLVLKQMKRRHSRDDLIATAARVRASRPEAALGADFIVGFPTESDAQFSRTLDLVDEAGLDFLHVFPYSPRPGTPAARLKPLPGDVVKARAARLRALGAVRLHARLDRLVGTSASVLMERNGLGRTECFASVKPDRPIPAGEIIQLRLTGHDGERLRGEPA